MGLIDILDRMHLKKSFHIKIDHLGHEILSKEIFSSPQFSFVIEVDDPDHPEKIDEIARIIKQREVHPQWIFQVRNEEEYQKVEILIERYSLTNTEIKPVYTGKNLRFFEDNIYLTEEDLQNPGLSRQEVFALIYLMKRLYLSMRRMIPISQVILV